MHAIVRLLNLRLSANPAHDPVEFLPTIVWNRCPRSHGTPAHHPVEWLPAITWNTQITYINPKEWSGRRESNPRMQLGKLPFYH